MVQTLATTVNRTIDDEYGDQLTGLKPVYNPPTAWTQGAACDYCAARPNKSDAFDQTWHDGTYSPNYYPESFYIELTFNGTAIWVYNIVAKLTLTALNFTLDGADAGSFTWNKDSSTQFNYNQLIFAQDNLDFTQHTLKLGATGANQSLVLFDYAIYSTEDNSGGTSSSSQTLSTKPKINVGAVAGGVVGGVAFLAIIIALLLCFTRKRHQAPENIEPFVAKSSNTRSILSPSSEKSRINVIPVVRETPGTVDSDLRTQVQLLREEVKKIRSARSADSPMTTQNQTQTFSSPPITSPQADLQEQISLLREEVRQLSLKQATGAELARYPMQSPPTWPDAEIRRQIASLREELEDLRVQQETVGLPDYHRSRTDVLLQA